MNRFERRPGAPARGPVPYPGGYGRGLGPDVERDIFEFPLPNSECVSGLRALVMATGVQRIVFDFALDANEFLALKTVGLGLETVANIVDDVATPSPSLIFAGQKLVFKSTAVPSVYMHSTVDIRKVFYGSMRVWWGFTVPAAYNGAVIGFSWSAWRGLVDKNQGGACV